MSLEKRVGLGLLGAGVLAFAGTLYHVSNSYGRLAEISARQGVDERQMEFIEEKYDFSSSIHISDSIDELENMALGIFGVSVSFSCAVVGASCLNLHYRQRRR